MKISFLQLTPKCTYLEFYIYTCIAVGAKKLRLLDSFASEGLDYILQLGDTWKAEERYKVV